MCIGCIAPVTPMMPDISVRLAQKLEVKDIVLRSCCL